VALLMEKMRLHPGVDSVRHDPPEDWQASVCSAAHHLGTARMAETPAGGVVNAELKVFGTPNLFVCDGSVFTTAGSVNPSLTICALGLRLGQSLVARLSTRPAAGGLVDKVPVESGL